MANDYLVPNGDDNGWPTGDYLDIDNGIDGPSASPSDATFVATTTDNDTVLYDLTSTAVQDSDNVTAVTIKIRARTGGVGNDRVIVDFLIGGTPQGAGQTSGNLTGSFAEYSFVDAVNWDVDWTAAQLNGAQVRLTADQTGKAETPGHEVSELEVNITYSAGAITREPPVGGVSVTGLTPTLNTDYATPVGGLAITETTASLGTTYATQTGSLTISETTARRGVGLRLTGLAPSLLEEGAGTRTTTHLLSLGVG